VTRQRNSVVSLVVGLSAWLMLSAGGSAADWPNLPALTNADLSDLHTDKVVLTGPSWPKIPLGAPAPVKSPFAFEVGARYWYSTSSVNFGFVNNNPSYGDPTSTINWNGATGHSGELFGRMDYRPFGIFVKGLVGGGVLMNGGTMDDRDFLTGQVKFSDTTSGIDGGDLDYGIIDVGVSYNVPYAGVRFGGFVGYHYWHEKFTANGVRCNPDDVGGAVCGQPGEWIVPANVPSMTYEPTWNAVRIGGDAEIKFLDRWSLALDVAGVPYATLTNNDSHLLRTDLGPVPNIIDKSTSGYGAEADIFVNYAITPRIEIGGGFRYWGLFAAGGTTQFGPSFVPNYPLRTFDDQRYGVLLQIKGKL
jgi:hypothetical protein